jgi:hypothetical protein
LVIRLGLSLEDQNMFSMSGTNHIEMEFIKQPARIGHIRFFTQ